jgi:hypothetical protein
MYGFYARALKVDLSEKNTVLNLSVMKYLKSVWGAMTSLCNCSIS